MDFVKTPIISFQTNISKELLDKMQNGIVEGITKAEDALKKVEEIEEGGGAEEIYVGTSEPVDPNVKIWVNPNEEEPETPSGNVAPPDWSQNDPTAADYVKNRTHWAEPNNTIAVQEQTVQIEEGQGTSMDILEPSFVIGDNYEVTYNGTIYNSVSFDFVGLGGLGNPVVVGGDDNGQPFFMVIIDGMLTVMDLVGNESATFKVVHNGEIVHKLPSKFVDNPIVVVSFADNGDNPILANMTVEEVFDAYNAGKYLVAKINSAGEAGTASTYFNMDSRANIILSEGLGEVNNITFTRFDASLASLRELTLNNDGTTKLVETYLTIKT